MEIKRVLWVRFVDFVILPISKLPWQPISDFTPNSLFVEKYIENQY